MPRKGIFQSLHSRRGFDLKTKRFLISIKKPAPMITNQSLDFSFQNIELVKTLFSRNLTTYFIVTKLKNLSMAFFDFLNLAFFFFRKKKSPNKLKSGFGWESRFLQFMNELNLR
jgi:hypothetical protein